MRLCLQRFPSIEPLALDAGGLRARGDGVKRFDRVLRGCHLQRPGPPIAYVDADITREAIDELVIHPQAPGGHRQQRMPQSLDERHQHTRRCLGRAESRTARVQQRHRGAADRQLVGEHLANHPGTDNRDVAIGHGITYHLTQVLSSLTRTRASPRDRPTGRRRREAFVCGRFRGLRVGTALAEEGD